MTKAGNSDYRIVVAKQASSLEEHAANELQSFLKQITGATLPIVADDEPGVEREILVGRNSRLDQIGARIDFKKLGTEGFTIRTVGRRLVIAGSPDRGALYGVYSFLEDHLGCRWYTPEVSRIPSNPNVVLHKIDETQLPAMAYRDIYYGEARERDFVVRQKINAPVLDDQRGRKASEALAPGITGWCHSLFTYLPPDKYFKQHPEYFALRDGKRTPTQLCLTNPDVLKIVVASLKKLMAQYPKARTWDLSQMDNGEPCQCPDCKAIDDREGSYSGSTVTFANKVAAHFPDKIISCLAYWYTMGPPKTVKPAKNVQIMFCADTDRRPPFYDWFRGWAQIAPRRYHWYYVIPCHNIIAPWPNFSFLQRDIKEWVASGMSGMFIEGSNEVGSEFSELRIYLLAKLIWDPNCDYFAIMDDFLQGYYGAAGPIIRQYIDAMQESMIAAHDELNGHDWCRNHAGTFLAPAMLAQYDALFDEAEKAVSGDPALLLRVQHARLPLMHAELQLAYGSVESRIATLYRMREISLKSNTRFYMDFGERPTTEYLGTLLGGLEKERAGKGR